MDYWQASCAHQPAGFVLLVQACVLQSCNAYWLPTPFYCFPFTSPPVRHRVPSHFKRSLPRTSATVHNVFLGGGGVKNLDLFRWMSGVWTQSGWACVTRCGVRLAKGQCAGEGGDSDRSPYFNDTLAFALNRENHGCPQSEKPRSAKHRQLCRRGLYLWAASTGWLISTVLLWK